ncbi:MAG: hypothetical protein FD181_2740 [Prolixibacteraceae bacterium]|nr:MAG: hypothetical protein FD181_2740 [Prolixibacteraceae bacterium]
MLKRNYYCLVAGFPDIVLDQKKIPFSLAELKQELKYHLHADDYRLVEYLFLEYDNINFLNLLQKKEAEFIPLGNYDQNFLIEEIIEPENLPVYIKKFLEGYREENPEQPKLSLENQLTWLYYDFMISQKNEFLKEWFTSLRDFKNIFSVYNSRKFGIDIETQMIGDYELTEAAKRTAAKDFGMANELPYIDQIIGIHENTDLVEQELTFDLLKWNYLDRLNTFNYFTIEQILGFVIKFMMVERWAKLDTEQSKEIFKKMLNDLENSFQFSKDFNINEKRR